MDSDVVATCNAIGFEDKNTKAFVLGEDYRLCLKDVLRWLKKDLMKKQTSVEEEEKSDDIEKLHYRSQLESLNLMLSKLLPILKDYCSEDEELFDMVLKIMVSLTTPVLLICNEKKPKTKEGNQIFLEMTMNLYHYKVAFGSSSKCWFVLAKHIGRILQLDWEHRFDEHKRMLEMIFILIRNLLHIPLAPSLETKTDDERNPQDRLIEAMKHSGILELLLYVLDSDEETDYYIYSIEIMSLLFRDHSAEYLAKSFKHDANTQASDRRSEYEKTIDKQEFDELLKKDQYKASKAKKYHRFKEATYQLKNVKGLGDNDVVIHKTPATDDIICMPSKAQTKRKSKLVRALVDDIFVYESTGSAFHRSTPRVRRILGEFCEEFLECYNKVFRHLRNDLVRKRGQANDETYFLWGLQFFMEYNRYSKTDLSRVLETVSVDVVHYVHTLIMQYLEQLKMQRRPHEYIPFSRRLHYAVKAYREFLFTVHFAGGSTTYQDEYLAKDIKNKIFYDEDYRELLMILLKDYNEKKMTKSVLKCLAETNHIFLNMLHKYCLLNTVVLVKGKKRKAATKKKSTKKTKGARKGTEKQWTKVLESLSEALKGNVSLPTAEENEDVLPMDSTVDFEPDLQKMSILKRLKKMLMLKKTAEAVALYRNAREAWSDDPEIPFGYPEISHDEEADSLKQIFMSGIDVDDEKELAEKLPVEKEGDEEEDNGRDKEKEGENENEGDKEKDDEEADQMPDHSAVQFQEYIRKYCHVKVIHPYALLLNTYDSNSDALNRCILKMFHRIAVDCDMYAMFFQASIFRNFQKLLREKDPRFKDFARFAIHIVSRFVAKVPVTENLLIEMLFWKKSIDATLIGEGGNDEVMNL
ncbi:Protein timeless -like protein [Halotydeus destructor]|nr:Protein timeless -like protein [Halotydeus destructor]